MNKRSLWQALVWVSTLAALTVNPVQAQLEEQGVARVNQMNNLEALLNICANGTEVMGIVVVPELFTAVVIGLLMRRYRFAGWMAAFAVLAPAFGLFNPNLVNMIVSAMRDTSGSAAAIIIMLLVEVVVLIVALVGIIALQFLPTIIAVRQHKPNKNLVIGLNLGGLFLPPLGIAAMFFALKQDDGAMPVG
ncbi:MAG: hypothetical protein IPJ49_19830 [Candidatus Obscuribacter sp.]|nr:hypothetical protein [Candidatus Obscuribacter sp.]